MQRFRAMLLREPRNSPTSWIVLAVGAYYLWRSIANRLYGDTVLAVGMIALGVSDLLPREQRLVAGVLRIVALVCLGLFLLLLFYRAAQAA